MKSPSPAWMRVLLAVAGIYNALCGLIAIAAPQSLFTLAGMAPLNYPEMMQCLGLLVALFGLGYWIASGDPVRYWPIVLVGLAGKVLVPLGFVKAVYEERFPLKLFWAIFANDIVWWLPFALILIHVRREHNASVRALSPDIQGWAMRATTQYDVSILEHSRIRPVLLVFLRYVGCPFCREALSELSARRRAIEAAGATVVLVHLGRENAVETILERYNLLDIPRVSDPKVAIYRAFGLEQGGLGRIFGPKVWLRGFRNIFLSGHGMGAVDGDIAQMPGVFLVFHGEILKAYRHRSVADRPDYVAMVSEVSAVPGTH